MTNWDDGYVSDIAYSGGIYREQMPAHLDAACLVAGFVPPVQLGEPFAYCELGCGVGETALTVAAGNSRARVWGFDFNPTHVAIGRSAIARTGLTNITIAERSFEELATTPPTDLPSFDYVTLHGVWSWISPVNQTHIVRFLRRHLRPGGLVYVSYNAMPGWAGRVGLQRLLYEAGRATGGRSDRRIRAALDFVHRVADAGCAAVDASTLKGLEGQFERGAAPYLVHEYMNAHWRPVFHGEVVEAMSDAKLTYAASANVLENFPQLCLRPEQVTLVASLPPELQQAAEDAFCGRMFRRDVFVRGPRSMLSHARAERVGTQRVALVVPHRSASLKIKVPAGEATLNAEFYGPALATLARGEASVASLRAAAAPGTAPAVEELLGILVGGQQAALVSNDPDAGDLATARRFNRSRLVLYAEEQQRQRWLVGARIGSAIPIGIDEALVYEVVAAAEEEGAAVRSEDVAISAAVQALMAARGIGLRVDGLDVAADMDVDVRQIVAEQVPIWRAIGAL